MTTNKPKRPAPPPGLSERAAQLWRDLVDEYDFAAPDLALLAECCGALDRADEARVVLDRDGLSVLDRYGSPKAHPLLEAEARSRALFARLLGQLRVNGVPAGAGRRGRPGANHTAQAGDPRLRLPEPPAPPRDPRRERIRLDGGPR